MSTPTRNPDRYHDARGWAQGSETYRDFEGLANSSTLLALVRYPDGRWIWDAVCSPLTDPPGVYEATRDITLNLLYEVLDQSGVEHINEDVIETTCRTVYEMLTCRWWIKIAEGEFKKFRPMKSDDAADMWSQYDDGAEPIGG